jgi:hypothetical protein
MRFSLQVEIGHGLVNGSVEVIDLGEGTMGEVVLLEIAPAAFNVVEFGSVFRQSFDGELPSFGQRFGRRLAGMDRAVVEHARPKAGSARSWLP